MGKITDKSLLLRLPGKIYKGVKSRADKNHRSVNSQIVYELDQKPVPIMVELKEKELV